jgi:hypothetical protein
LDGVDQHMRIPRAAALDSYPLQALHAPAMAVDPVPHGLPRESANLAGARPWNSVANDGTGPS